MIKKVAVKENEFSEKNKKQPLPTPKKGYFTKESIAAASTLFDDDEDFESEDDAEFEDEELEDEELEDEELEDELEEDTEEETENAEESEDDDLFVLKVHEPRQAKLEEKSYKAKIGKITGKKQQGEFGIWKRIEIPFEIQAETGGKVIVTFRASTSLKPTGRLYPIIKGILCKEPTEDFNIKQLEGMKAIVEICHNTDEEGNVWENVVSAEGITVKR